MIATKQLVMEVGLSGRPTECRYCWYPASKGRCHGNHFFTLMGYNFGCMIASDTRFDSKGWVFGVKLSDADIADFEVLRDVAIVTIFGFLYMGCTLTPPGEYNWTIHVRRRCGLMSNYFDHLLLLLLLLLLFCGRCRFVAEQKEADNVRHRIRSDVWRRRKYPETCL